MRHPLLIAVILTAIASCTPFSQQTMQEVKREIAFGEVANAPETFKGETVLWGGVIIETVTRSGDTLILVRQTDLDFQKRPTHPDKSAGRFIIHYRGFLDPAIYDKEREITVVGTVDGKEERSIGEHRYVYPVIGSRALYLWEKWEPLPYHYDPWHRDPFFYPWRFYPRYRY